MHRQHPYAGYGPPPGARRTDSPPGVGPDRTRGPSGSFNARGRPHAAPPPQRGGAPRPHAAHGYESPPYGLPQMDNPYAEDGYNFRNGNGGEFNDYESSLDGKRGRQGGARREPDDKVHDSLIEERLQRERPCRTLFIRNIKYETDSNEFRRKFEEFGEIKTFFDLISHRGMVFCTYFDMRAAERAKERLQGTELAGRPIDVHYSLPREDQKNEANQGIIIISLIDSPTRAAIDDLELRRKLTVFGDVKTITPNNGRHDSRQVEFYDLRSAEEAHGKLRHQPLQDGILETEFAYLGDAPPPGPAMQERARQERGTRGRNRGRGRGGRAGGGGGGYDGRGRDWEEEDGYGRERGRMSPARYEERWRERSPPPRGRSNGDLGADREKLEQAKKVQDLLAALKSTGAASSLPPAGSSGPPPPPPQSMYGYPPPPNASGGPPPPPPPQFQLPPNMAHLGALLQQAASLPPQQAQAVAGALSQYQQQPYQTQQYPPLPPQSAMYPGSQPPPSSQPPYGYPPPPGGGNGPPPSAYGGPDIYSLLGQKQGSQSGPPPSALPPDAARYNYNSPPQQGASGQGTGASGSQPHSIQDIMALLKRSSQS